MTGQLFPRASRLGFGCASLGSRVGRREGLNALAAAFEHGVNWFDLAPSYGDGDAESIFVHFAKSRRTDIHICTKCGIEPAKLSALQRTIRPLARTFVTIAPQMRELAARSRRSPNVLSISAALIRDSLDRSLERLGTSYIDVYALHDPSPGDIARDDVQRQLEVTLTSGKVRAIGIAGSVEAIIEARRVGLPVSLVQTADRPFEGAIERLRAATGPDYHVMLSTHSIFGRTNLIRLLSKQLGSKRRLRDTLASSGYVTRFDEAVHAFLLDCALARNPNGVVLLSMFSRHHLLQNVARMDMADMNPIAKELRSHLNAASAG